MVTRDFGGVEGGWLGSGVSTGVSGSAMIKFPVFAASKIVVRFELIQLFNPSLLHHPGKNEHL